MGAVNDRSSRPLALAQLDVAEIDKVCPEYVRNQAPSVLRELRLCRDYQISLAPYRAGVIDDEFEHVQAFQHYLPTELGGLVFPQCFIDLEPFAIEGIHSAITDSGRRAPDVRNHDGETVGCRLWNALDHALNPGSVCKFDGQVRILGGNEGLITLSGSAGSAPSEESCDPGDERGDKAEPVGLLSDVDLLQSSFSRDGVTGHAGEACAGTAALFAAASGGLLLERRWLLGSLCLLVACGLGILLGGLP